MYTDIGPEKAIALIGLILTREAISNCLKQNPITPNRPWNAMNVHRPPIWHHLVNEPWASGPHNSSNEWPIQLAGVDTAAVKKLHPSK